MLPAFFGGEVLGDDETTVRYVKAVSLSYFLDVSDEWKILVGDAWEKQLLNDVNKFAENYYPDLEVKAVFMLLLSKSMYTRMLRISL